MAATTTKKVKDKDAPKGAKSAYLFFCASAREDLKREEPTLSFGELAQRLSAQWKLLSKSDKDTFEEQAREDQARFRREQAEYNESRVKDDDAEGDDDASEGKSKKRSRSKAPKDDGPKRALTAFFHFSAAHRARIHENNPEMKIGDIAKVLSERWKAMSESDRAPYEEKAQKDRERYRQEREDYEADKPQAKRSSSTPPAATSPVKKASSSSSQTKTKETPAKKPAASRTTKKPAAAASSSSVKLPQSAAFKYYAETCKPDIRRTNPGLTLSEFQAVLVDRWQQLSDKKRKIYEQCAKKEAQKQQRLKEKRMKGEPLSSDDDDGDDDDD